METASQIRDFLVIRRAEIAPERVGLARGTSTRRVPGLRREEGAVLAGVSTDGCTRLEKGHVDGVSEDVLHAVARAPQLDEAETTGVEQFDHPVVGRLEVEFDSFEVTAARRLTLTACSATPGSPSEDAPRLLASWAATASTADAG